MPIPITDEMVLPVLQYIADGQEYRRKNIIDMLTNHFSLTEDERRRLSDGVTMERPLVHRGLIERPRTGHYQITALGREILSQSLEEVSASGIDYGTQADLFASGSEGNDETEGDSQDPEKSIKENYDKIREELAAELLRQIKSNTPGFFEELVIDLLVAMGYGGSREDAQAVGRSRDGGIDGVIKEDRLGLDVIYVQAKRWEGNVGEPQVRDFVGALQGKRARKGICITTSEFYNTAWNYVLAIDARDSKVVLIDGNQLAQYMIKHNVGVSTAETYEIKRVDSDYFAEDTENS